MSKIRLSAIVCLLSIVAVSGCKSPFDRTRDASSGGGTGAITGGTNFVVFSSELKTGGGAFLYPGAENQSLAFNDTSNPISARSIRYTWNGGDVSAPGCTPNPLHTFAGFDLMHVVDNSPTLSVYTNTPGRNLSASGYHQVTFFARGSLSSNTVIKVEVAAQGVAGGCPVPPHVPCVTLSSNGVDDDPNNPCGVVRPLGSSWNSYSISGITAGELSNIKDFFKATYVFNQTAAGGNLPGGGGTVYFDNIQYTP